MEFSVLGRLRAHDTTGPLEISSPRERVLLARLVASAGRMVPVDDLVDALWPESPPRSAVKTLQNCILRLRNILEPERDGTPRVLLRDGEGYRLDVPMDAVDANRFLRLAELGRRASRERRLQSAADTLAEALAMWHGPAYGDVLDTAFGRAESRRLEEARLAVLEDLQRVQIELGHAGVAVGELERLVAEHPLRERLWVLLVLGLYREGRQGEALLAYERARHVLAQELGIDPGPELRDLHRRVLAQDRLLGGPGAASRLPEPLRPVPGAALVGRDHVMEALRAAWAEASNGGARVVVLRGPAGAGTTRIASALAEEVAEAGGAVTMTDGPSDAPTLLVTEGGVCPEPAARRLALAINPTQAHPAAEAIALGPLDRDHARALLAHYVPPERLNAADSLLDGKPLWPGDLVDGAVRFLREAAVERVASAVTSAARAGTELASARDAVAEGMVFLQQGETVGTLDPAQCPWRGLAAYDVDDAPWFAGRERLVAELVAQLAGSRLVCVVGPSGSGKSSVVRAGLLAMVAAGAVPHTSFWRRLVLRPGQHPMRELSRVALDGRPGDLGDLLADLARTDHESVGNTLLVVDQLEELWTTCADAEERAAFLDTVTELVDSDGGGARAVLVVRADYVARLAEHPRLATLLGAATCLVGSPTPDEVRRAVERPAARTGLALDVGLVDAVVEDAGNEPGLLPLLSVSMTQTWAGRDGHRLTLAEYVSTGGLRGAIAHLAESEFHAMDPAGQAATRRLLLRLTGPGTGPEDVTRRAVPLAELASLPGAGMGEVIERLVAARLLTLSGDTVEVAHEALFREWPRLGEWLADDVAGRDLQRRLTLAAGEWDAEGGDPGLLWQGARLAAAAEVVRTRPDELTPVELAFVSGAQDRADRARLEAEERAATSRRQNRRLRVTLGLVVALLAAALVAGVVAVRSRDEAATAGRAAEAKRLAATALNLDATDLALLTAVEAARVEPGTETQGALLTLLTRQPEVFTRMRTDDRFLKLAVTADGRTAYLGEVGPVLRAVDTETGREHWKVQTLGQVNNIVPFSDGGLAVVQLGEERTVLASLDPADGRPRWELEPTDIARVAGPEASTDPLAAVLTRSGVLRAVTATHVLDVDPDGGRVLRAVAFPDEVRFTWSLFVWTDGRVSFEPPDRPNVGMVFDPARPARGFVPTEGFPLGVSPDGERVIVTTSDDSVSQVRMLDGATLRPVGPWQVADRHAPRTAVWSADSRQVLVPVDNHVDVRDGRTGALLRRLEGHHGEVMGAQWAGPERDLVWSASRDGTATGFDLSGRRTVLSQQPTEITPHAGAVATDGRLATILDFSHEGEPNVAHLVDAVTGKDLGPLRLEGLGDCACQAAAVGITPDGSRALVGVEAFDARTFQLLPKGWLVVWDTFDRSVSARIELPWAVYGVDVTPDGRRAVLNGAEGIAIVDLEAARVVHRSWQPRTGWIAGSGQVEISPDGRLAAIGGDRGVLLVDVRSGRVLDQRLPPAGIATGYLSFAWSKDGSTLVAGTDVGWVEFLSPEDLQPRAPRRLVTGGWVLDLEMSPDGRRFASFGIDGDVMLWSTDTWSPYGQRVLDARTYGFLHFPPEGDRLEVFYDDRRRSVLRTDPAGWPAYACRSANRQMTRDEAAVLLPGRSDPPLCERA